MATVSIMPCLDLKDGRVVKGVQFVQLVDAGDPVEVAKAYAADGARELALLDITATWERRESAYAVLERVAAAVPEVVITATGVFVLRHLPIEKKAALLSSNQFKNSMDGLSLSNVKKGLDLLPAQKQIVFTPSLSRESSTF